MKVFQTLAGLATCYKHQRNQDDVDAAQEVLVRLSGDKFCPPEGQFLAYFSGVVAHVVANVWRQAKRGCFEKNIDSIEDWPNHLGISQSDYLTHRLNLEQQVEWALARLPRPHGLLLALCNLAARPYEEAAGVWVSDRTILQYVTRSKRPIRAAPHNNMTTNRQ